MKNIFVINGSANEQSSNQQLIDHIAGQTKDIFNLTVFNALKQLPHFDPERSVDNPPPGIIALRQQVEQADALLICTPEYVFSMPAGLKNAIEWCVSTTVFAGKPTGLITASANGERGHEELKLVMKTLMAKFTDETTLLIRGIKGKTNEQGTITDEETRNDLTRFITAFNDLAETIRRD